MRRCLSTLNRIGGRPHRPREAEIREILAEVGIEWEEPSGSEAEGGDETGEEETETEDEAVEDAIDENKVDKGEAEKGAGEVKVDGKSEDKAVIEAEVRRSQRECGEGLKKDNETTKQEGARNGQTLTL